MVNFPKKENLIDYIMMGFFKKENFDGLHKCFLEAKFTKFPFLENLMDYVIRSCDFLKNENGEHLCK